MFKINLSPAVKGFLKGLLGAIVFGSIHYITDASHLIPLIGAPLSAVVAAAAVAWEHSHDLKTGASLLGAIKPKA